MLEEKAAIKNLYKNIIEEIKYIGKEPIAVTQISHFNNSSKQASVVNSYWQKSLYRSIMTIYKYLKFKQILFKYKKIAKKDVISGDIVLQKSMIRFVEHHHYTYGSDYVAYRLKDRYK
jgi:hypothetical protein